MTRFRRCFFLVPCVLLLYSLASSGQTQPWAHEGSDLAPDPRVVWGRLDNGFRYAIMPNSQPPGRTAMRFFVQAGSLMETEEQRGLAHFLEHMAFNGTNNFSATSMVQYFQRLGIAFGADINAYTSFNETVYMLELPGPEPELLADGLRLFRDYADGMLLEEKELEKERGVILAEKLSRDSVQHRTRLARFDFLLPESLISRRDVIGLEQVIKTAGRPLFADFYRTWYRADRLALAVVGAVDIELCEKLIKEHFSSLAAPKQPASEPDLGQITASGLRAAVHIEAEAPSVNVLLQVQRRSAGAPDTFAERLRQFERYLAQRLLHLRFVRLREAEDSPFTSASAYNYDWMRFLDVNALSLDTTPENWRQALALAEQEVRRALAYGFTESEFNELQVNVLHEYERAVETASTRLSPGLAQAIVSSISNRSVFTSPELDLEHARKALAGFTVERAGSVFRELWDTPDLHIFVSGNLDAAIAKETVFEVFTQSREQKIAPPEELAAVEFAYAATEPAGKVLNRVHHEDLGITQLLLENGVRVNLKQTDFEANVIRILARCGSGMLELPASLSGLASLAERVFVPGALGRHSRNELRQLLAGRDAGMSFSAAADAFTLSGQTTQRDLRFQLQLLRAFMLDPGLRTEAFAQARRELQREYLNLKHTPAGVYSLEVRRFLAGGDHRFGVPPEEDVLARTRNEIRDWLLKPLREAYLEVSLVGDFQEPQTLDAVLAVLGGMPSRTREKKVAPELRKVSFPQHTPPRIFEYNSEVSRALITVSWPTADIWDIHRTRRLDLLAGVIQERLRIRAREQMGAVYGVHVMSRPSDTFTGYGLLSAVSIAAPERAHVLAELFQQTAAEIAAAGVAEEELELIRKPRVNSVTEHVRRNDYWLHTVLASSQEYPQRLDWARSIVADYTAATAAEVSVLAAEFVPRDKAVQLLVMPAE